jgi:hypothetical protein
VLAALPRASTDTGGSVTKEQVEPKPLIPLTNREPSFIPLAFLTTALVGGMVVGVLMRTNEVLAIWPQVATWRWAKVTGIPPSEISKRLFNELHPEHPPARSGDSDDKKDSAKDQAMNRGIPLSAGVGFSAAAPKEYCAKISGERGERLQIIMIGLGTSPYAELAKALSVRDVERTVDLVLCPTKTSH